MNEKSKKLVRYSTAAAALLAVSGGANAAIVPGKIMTEYDGDTFDNILDYDEDVVLIYINNDEIPDFVAYMSSWLSDTPFGIYDLRSVFVSAYNNVGASGNSIGNTNSYRYYVNKFQLNEPIGPLINPYYFGIIADYSEGEAPPSPPFSPLSAPFSNSMDEGFIGIQTTLTASGQQHYGWIHVVIGEDLETTEFIACALETAPGQSILAGNSTAVPLLPIASAAGLGLIGLMAAMKKRRKLTA
jgi:hypothetical protein